MKLAKDGAPTIGAFAFMLAGAYALGFAPVAAVLLVPLAASLWFYRDPDRTPPDDPNAWVSPADGRVIEIEEDAYNEYTGPAMKIGIYMNGLDVHVNRFPTAGTVEYIKYVPGRKWFVFAPKASELNERLYVGVSTAAGRTTLVQIAGIVARRIAPRVKMGVTLARGERYGMIKLGSKVDVYMPAKVRPTVELGQKVRAGESVIGVVE